MPSLSESFEDRYEDGTTETYPGQGLNLPEMYSKKEEQ